MAGARSAALRFRFTGDALAVRRTLIALDAGLARHGIGATDRANAELVLAEILNNIVEHAYPAPGGPVEVTVELVCGGLRCQIVDHGVALPGDCLPPPVDLPDPAALPEGGFGWPLIRHLSQDLSYCRAGDRNRLCLTLPAEAFA